MPLWLEVLINVIGYAGFIAIAMYHKSYKDSGRIKSSRRRSTVRQLLQGRAKAQAAATDEHSAENLGLVIGRKCQ